jgi:hypothetical protein
MAKETILTITYSHRVYVAMRVISLEIIGNNRFTDQFKNAEEWIWLLKIAKRTIFMHHRFN